MDAEQPRAPGLQPPEPPPQKTMCLGRSLCFWYWCLFALCAFIGIVILLSGIRSMGPDDQVLIHGFYGKTVVNGPGAKIVPPVKNEKRKATKLDDLQFALIKDELNGNRRMVQGPQKLFLGAYDTLMEVGTATKLDDLQYALVKDELNGARRTEKGPMKLFVGPYDTVVGVYQATKLDSLQYAVVKDDNTGNKRIERGPQKYFAGPYELVLGVHNVTKLGPLQYALVKDDLTGVPRIEEGPQKLFIGAYETLCDGCVFDKYVLQKDQYVRFIERTTAVERVLIGPQTVVPGPTEDAPAGVEMGVFLDKETAVLVRSKQTGQQRLVTRDDSADGVFFPPAYEMIVEQRRLIHVLPHEVVIVRDPQSVFHIFSGMANNESSAGTTFFLQPHHEIVEFEWSDFLGENRGEPAGGGSVFAQKIKVTKIDLRDSMAFFKFQVRTNDNVKLSLSGTLFWRLTDVEKMLRMTGDPAGDVWQHSRSALIQAVSKVKLAAFMDDFNDIVMAAFVASKQGDSFYSERGIEVVSMELTHYEPVEEKTAEVLQQIIQETTNRINRLQAQQSENEVRAAKLEAENAYNQDKMSADILLEQQRTNLTRITAENERIQAQIKGEAEGMKFGRDAASFLSNLDSAVPDIDSRLDLYKLQKTLEAQNTNTHNIAHGGANLFLTPDDVNLRLDQRTVAAPPPSGTGAAAARKMEL